jgi:hypothetical protein
MEETTIEFTTQPVQTSLFIALMNFQTECPTIPKLKKGFGYNYAELSKTMEFLKPLLKKHGIGFVQLIQKERTLTTIVFHAESGQQIESSFEMPQAIEIKGMNLFQAEGTKISYYKRYCLLSFLGVFSEDEDNDAKGQQKKPETNSSNPSNPSSSEPKKKLNDKQFISVLQAVNGGQYTPEEVKESFDLSPEQIKSIESINN